MTDTERPDWMAAAACIGHSPSLWYPDLSGYEALRQARQAKAICATCPVRPECAQAGETEMHGIWGGLAPKERHVTHIAVAQRRAQAEALAGPVGHPADVRRKEQT